MLDAHIQEAKEKAEHDGMLFQANPTPELLHRYQISRDDLIALQECAHTDNINQQTTVSSMWHLIKRVIKKTPATAHHYTPAEYAQQLVDTWSQQSSNNNLPPPIQNSLSSQAPFRKLRLVVALLKEDKFDTVAITEEELLLVSGTSRT